MSKYSSKEQIAAYNKTYYQKHKNKIRDKAKNYYVDNKETILKRTSAYARETKYGLSFENFKSLLELQNNCCAICECGLSLKGQNTHVDHDHDTGEVRGILCKRCNNGLGHFKDNTDLLEKAAQYLVKYENQSKELARACR